MDVFIIRTEIKSLLNIQILLIVEGQNLACSFTPFFIELTFDTHSYFFVIALPPRQYVQVLNSIFQMRDLEISIKHQI